MLKISKPLSTEKTATYYQQEYGAADQAYYSEKEQGQQIIGTWHGQLAHGYFGLSGGVREDHYKRMAEGQDPHSGEQLVKHRNQAAAGHEPAWLQDDAAWAEHLENVYLEALSLGRDWFVAKDQADSWNQKPKDAHPARPQYSERQQTLLEMHRIAGEVYRAQLMANSKVQGYVRGRGVNPSTEMEFALGFSDGKQLLERLRPFGDELLEASGLFVKLLGQWQERFGGRLIIPIRDEAGQVVAFGARKLGEGDEPKYLNSPATEIYNKSALLYNLDRAERNGRLVLVEGYMDVLAAHSAGVRNVVASCGTALTDEQVGLLKENARAVIVNTDPDAGGRKAAERDVEKLLDTGVRVRVLDLEHDPAEYIQTRGGKEYRARVEQVAPLIEWLTARAREVHNVSDVYGRTDALRSILHMAEHVQPEGRKTFEQEVRRHLDLPEDVKKKKYSEHVAGFDLTFGAPKSFSVTALVGGDKGIVEDHQAAVKVALDAMEQYTQARLPDQKPVTTRQWAAACFLHDSARPVNGEPPNPHLHTHAVVFNMTLAEKIRSVQPQEWYRIQSYGSAVYHAELAYRARKRGYTLEHGKNYSMDIAGYTPEYLRAMSARTEEIEKEKELKGLVGAEADERVNKRLREAKQTWEPAKLWEEHKRQAQELGNDPAAVVENAKVGQSHLLPEDIRKGLAQEAITFAKNRLYEGSAVVDHYELMRDALRYGLGQLRLSDVEHAFEVRLAQQEREFLPVGHVRTNAPGERFTTVEMKTLERESIKLALEGRGTVGPLAGKITRDEFREKYKHQRAGGKTFDLNDSQLWAAWNVLQSKDKFQIMAGLAGTGKSSVMEPIAEVAERSRWTGFDVRGLAPTGGAALNLGDIGIRTQTLQSHLIAEIPEGAPKRLYILDEGSLVSTRQFHDFMKGVRPQDRVIVAYDPRQHQSVEAGRVIEEMEEAGVAAVKLQKIVRQRNAPELLEAIEDLAAGRTIDGLRRLDSQGRIEEIENRWDRFAELARRFAEYPKETRIVSPDNRSIGEINLRVRKELQGRGTLHADKYEAHILVGRRDVKVEDRKRAGNYYVDEFVRFGKSVKELGVRSGAYGRVVSVDAERNLVRLRLGSREVTYNPRDAYGVDLYSAEKRMLAVGDRIQITRAWKYPKGIANREAGEIVKLDAAGNATVKMDRGGGLISWNLAEMPHFEYAYARTSYAEQSTTAERVLLHLDSGDSTVRNLIDKRGVYVGASRAELELTVFTDSKEGLLAEHSPVNRITQKSAALNTEEIAGFAVA